jgi:hypothetical protein
MTEPMDTKMPQLGMPQPQIFQPSGLAVTVGFTGILTPAAQAIIDRVTPKAR